MHHAVRGGGGGGEFPPPGPPCYGWRVVVAVAVLFVVFGSVGEAAVTEAVFVIVPLLVGFTTMVIVTAEPLATLPMSQLTMFLDGLSTHDPLVVVADP